MKIGSIFLATLAAASPAASGPVLDRPDYSGVGDARVLGWGDDHGSTKGKDAFTNALHDGTMKDLGVKYVGMEMFDSGEQTLINDYFAADLKSPEASKLRVKLRDALGAALDPSAMHSDAFTPLRDQIMDIVDAIKASGLKMLALEPKGWTNGPSGPQDPRAPPAASDETWVRAVEGILTDDSNAKIVVFAGEGHFLAAGLLGDQSFINLLHKTKLPFAKIYTPDSPVGAAGH
jgi:hypothetical protein